jgi:acid phosphatase
LKKHYALLLAVLRIGLVPTWLGAQQPSPKVSVLTRAESIQNLASPEIDRLKAQLRQYHECTCTCGCYAKDLDVQADRAIAFLRARAAHRSPQEKLALVLDIDETTLSNYEQEVKMDFGYDGKAFDDWIESGQAPAIPGTLKLYKEAQRLGVSVFFITGRHDEPQRAATEKNLSTQGFTGWQQLIMRSAAQYSMTALEYKSAARGTIVAKGYKMVLNVGDQWSDLGGEPEAELSVKYPDPFYFIP